MRLKGNELLSSFRKGEIHSLYLFLGEGHLQEEALKELMRVALGKETPLNFDIFFADEVKIQELIDAVETLPIDAQRRLVFLKRVELLPKREGESLVRYLKDGISPSASLVLCGQRLDRGGELYNVILKRGVVVDFWPPFDNEIPGYLKDIAKKKGKELDGDAAATLLELKGRDLNGLLNELEKLIIYTGERPIITSRDVLEGSSGWSESSIFDLLEAVGEKDIKGSLKRLHILLLGGEAPLRILGFLIQEFRLIYKTKLLIGEGKEKEEIREHLNILSKRRFAKILKATSVFGLPELESVLSSLLSADTELKSRDKVLHPLILELLLIRLCGTKGGHLSF